MPTSNAHTHSKECSTYVMQYRQSVVKGSHWSGRRHEKIRACNMSLSSGLVPVHWPGTSGIFVRGCSCPLLPERLWEFRQYVAILVCKMTN